MRTRDHEEIAPLVNLADISESVFGGRARSCASRMGRAIEREGRDPRGFFKCRHVGSGLPPKFLDQLEQEAVPFKLEWFR